MTETTTRTQPPELPASMVRELKALKAEEDKTGFYDAIASLRVNGWTLKMIADGLGYSRSIVSIWESKSTKDVEDLPETVPLPEDIDPSIKPTYSQFRLTKEQQIELYRLTKIAEDVRRYTPEDAPEREAARKLEDLLHHYKDNGASLNALSVACDVSRRAIAQRLEKRAKEEKRRAEAEKN